MVQQWQGGGGLGGFLDQLNSQIGGGRLDATSALSQLAGYAGQTGAGRQPAGGFGGGGGGFAGAAGPSRNPNPGGGPGGWSLVNGVDPYANVGRPGDPVADARRRATDDYWRNRPVETYAPGYSNEQRTAAMRQYQGLPPLAGQGGPGTAQTGAPTQPFGFQPGQGVPGGNAIQYLERMGMPIPPHLRAVAGGRAVQRGDLNRASQQLGGAFLPTPQAMQRMSPSEQQFTQGFYETVLGLPFSDIMQSIQQPFAGLRSARAARGR